MSKIRQLAYPKSRNCPRNERAAKLYEDDFRHIRKFYENDFNYIFAGEVFRDKDSEKERQIEKKQVENNPETFHDFVRKLANELCEKYPLISNNEDVFRGKPHLKGTRFTVADVLSAMVIYVDTNAVLEAYQNRYTEEQFKEAIRFARDFLLSAHSVK